MFKYIFCFLVLMGQAEILTAQSVQDTLFVVPGKKNLYFYHVVEKGESLYGIAREYKLDPKVLAQANTMTLKTPLKLFQLLKVPLDSNNLVQSASVNVSGLTPLYHKVIKGETLYHIGQMHDKVDPALLKKWNHLSNNEVKNGQYLVVGWLNAAPANNNIPAQAIPPEETANPAVAANETTVNEATPVGKEKPPAETAKESQAAASVPSAPAGESDNSFLHEVIASENRNRTPGRSPQKATLPPANTSEGGPAVVSAATDDDNAFAVGKKSAAVAVNKKATPAAPPASEPIEDKTVAEEIPAPATQPEKDTPVKDNPFAKMLDEVTHRPQNSAPAPAPKPPVASSGTNSVQAVASGTTDTPAPTTTVETDSATEEVAPAEEADSVHLTTSAKSEFEQEFEKQTGNETNIEAKKGAAGWFRSNVKSGSGRYYALCNELPRGTIVKIINPISGKYVLAKVLDAIPKQKENYNLIVKLSDAAMQDLGVTQSRFWCEIQFAKSK